MEVVYCDEIPKNMNDDSIVGVIGDVNDLINLGFDINGISYDDKWTVKRLLNGWRLFKNKRIEAILNYLEIDKNILNKKLVDLSKTDLKFALLAYLLINNKKIIIFDYFDVCLVHNAKKKLAKIIRLLKKDGFKIYIISNDLEYMDTIVDKLIVVNNHNIVYNGKLSDFRGHNDNMPEISKFIELANEKGANLSNNLDRRELLKDIYRSVSS